MEIRAILNKYRRSPKKMREVVPVLKGLTFSEAEAQLSNLPKGYAADLKKLLASALANAKNIYNLKEEDLLVKDVVINEKSVMKRWRARAHGSAAKILKRTSQIEIILGETAEAREKRKKLLGKKVKEVKKLVDEKDKSDAEEKKKDKKEERFEYNKSGSLPSKFRGTTGRAKKIFRRKSI
jgi:large subunit ribosomal protein L22